MKAIVLTFDKYRDLTDHMIFQYDKLWPNNPFKFHIPYQTIGGINNSKRKYIKSDVNIKRTVLNLIKDLDENEWVYWCIDDKYPIRLVLPRVKDIYAWIPRIKSKKISGILFCRCRGLLKNKYIGGKKITDQYNNIYLERNSFQQIWIHQFLRVKVIRYLFSAFPDTIKNAKEMDFLKSMVKKPDDYELFVSAENLAEFGESTSRGLITQNCFENILNNNLKVPDWHKTTNNVVKLMGTIDERNINHPVGKIQNYINFIIKKLFLKHFHSTLP